MPVLGLSCGMPVLGLGVQPDSRCDHWHTSLDILALKAPCCSKFFACATCHNAVEQHSLEPWPDTEAATRELALLCGGCQHTFTIATYMARKTSDCPSCHAPMNPGCRKHWNIYFSEGLQRRVAGLEPPAEASVAAADVAAALLAQHDRELQQHSDAKIKQGIADQESDLETASKSICNALPTRNV